MALVYLDVPYIEAKSYGGVRSRTDLFVLHATDNTANARSEAGYSTWRPDGITPAHGFVDANEMVQIAPLTHAVWGAYPRANAISLQLEMCGRDGAVPEAVWRNAAKYTRLMCDAYNVPLVKLTPADLNAGKRGICGHWDVTRAGWGGTHTDPDPFPWVEFIDAVKGGEMVTSAEIEAIAKRVWDVDYIPSSVPSNPLWHAKNILAADRERLMRMEAALGEVAAAVKAAPAPVVDVAALADAIVAKLPPVTAGLSVADVEAAVRSVLGGTVGSVTFALPPEGDVP